MKIRKEDALEYHRRSPKGKIEVVSTKPISTQRDLSLAYSPGVAFPCLEIAENVEKVYEYTGKDNLVAVLTNGTAVLGLGNIGPEAAKPVMEGKAVLFKKFAGIDVFDIEIRANTVEEFVAVAKALEPTFGGINMEDVRAPESFEIEQRLCKEMSIPVMHDDQHGTAIISSAALLNALTVTNRTAENLKVVVLGAGAAALACLSLYQKLGIKTENVTVFDKDGHIWSGRSDVNSYQAPFARHHQRQLSLVEAFQGAELMLGLSAGGTVTAEMVAGMASNPIIFALANPDPEITWEEVMRVRPDAIMATGRSDYPNQVNNALGFPYIFRGALDVRATAINDEMKIASAKAIAALAHEPVPDSVMMAYSDTKMSFGKDYIIPKPVDPRLITHISTAVAKAAMESGVARKPITDFEAYKDRLLQRVGIYESISRSIIDKAKKAPKRVVFGEADTYKVLKAAQILNDERIAIPVLLGNKKRIAELIEENFLDLEGVDIIDPLEEDIQRDIFGKLFHDKRKRKGTTLHDAVKLMRDRNYFGPMMVATGVADAYVSGLTKNYPSSIRPALQAIGRRDGASLVCGMHIVRTKRGPFFFADTTVNKNPSTEDLVAIAKLVAEAVKLFNHTPRIAMLSYSNFGSNVDVDTQRIIDATQILQREMPDLVVEGDVQANVAVREDILHENYNFSMLAKHGVANTFIFPNLFAGNIAYKMMEELGGAEIIGPIVLGMNKPVHILQLGSHVRDIVNIAAFAVVDAQVREAQS
jgi:malate dehydrogenase (oxaloacetate-decarboxylating)(NADP+)